MNVTKLNEWPGEIVNATYPQPILTDPHIEDSKLEAEYNEREKYNFIKRKIIEHKYTKAVEKKIIEDYHKASIKDN